MELIYVWIDSFKSLRKSSYLLNKGFSIKISDSENYNDNIKKIELEKIEEKNYFFGNNINNINVIIGKNCSGKTSFLECLGGEYSINDDAAGIKNKTKFLLIYYDNISEKYLFESVGVTFIFNGKVFGKETEYAYVIKWNEHIGEYQEFCNTGYGPQDKFTVDDTYYIHVKNALNQFPRYDGTAKLVNRKIVDLNNAYISKQLQYLLDSTNNEGIKNNYVRICIKANYKEGVYFGSRYNDYFPITRQYFEPLKYMTISGQRETAGKNTLKSLFIISVLEAYLGRQYSNYDKEKVSKEIEEYIKTNRLLKMKDMGYSYIEDEVLKKLVYKIAELTHIMNKYKIWNFIRKLNNVVKEIPKEYFQGNGIIELCLNYVETNSKIIQGLRELTEMYDRQMSGDYNSLNILNFSFMGLSDGLLYKIKLYSTIESIIIRNRSVKYNNIILLLDEPELYMHPEWARRFIYELFSLFHDKYPDLKFQIIITTHSPFLLSDLPVENIALIKKI